MHYREQRGLGPLVFACCSFVVALAESLRLKNEVVVVVVVVDLPVTVMVHTPKRGKIDERKLENTIVHYADAFTTT